MDCRDERIATLRSQLRRGNPLAMTNGYLAL